MSAMRSFLCIAILFYAFIPRAEAKDTAGIDSLLTVLKSQDSRDTLRVNTLLNLAGKYIEAYEADTVLLYSREALDLSRQVGYRYGEARACRNISIGLWNQGDLNAAWAFADTAISMFGEMGDSAKVVATTFNRALITDELGHTDLALESYLLAVDYFRRNHRNDNLCIALNSLGLVYADEGDYQNARRTFLEAIRLAEQEEMPVSVANAKSNLGQMYFDHGRIDTALALFQTCLQIDRDLDLQWGIGYQLSNIGMVLAKKGRVDEALDYQFESLELRRELDYQVDIISSLSQIGNTLLEAKRFAEAIPYFKEGLELARKVDSPDWILEEEQRLSECYAGLGQYRNAYVYQLAASATKDSLQTVEKGEKIQELMAFHQAEQRESALKVATAENALMDAEINQQKRAKTFLIIGLILLALLAGLVIRGQRLKLDNEREMAAKEREVREARFKMNTTELELKALRAQMNPHFIFNSMNSINRLILADENEKASRNLSKFAKLIRMILDFSEKREISLQEELEMLKAYVELEAVRFKGKIDYNVDVDPRLDLEDIEVPSMVLQPFIENAIWHGLNHRQDDSGKIRISIRQKGDLLHCSIEDNGVGREKALELRKGSTLPHKSMAIKVTRERLSLRGHKKVGDLIRIIDLKDEDKALGTRVELMIPV